MTLTATDFCGNFADTTFMISVLDTEAPEWTQTDFPGGVRVVKTPIFGL